jgi:3-isopropylmalate/(R)-2-methylmalate dehydratase small subunit
MEPLKTIVSRTVVLPSDNIDTDQIIPARFLKGTTKTGLGEKLFSDWRYDAQGNRSGDFVLNRPESAGAQVLVAGDNFGCGSSREHAPWALVDYGFRAVVSTSIADIFRNNALKNGLLPIVVEPALHRRLLAEPGTAVTISLEDQTLRLGDGTTAKFTVDPFSRYCLLNGVDELAFLMSADADIQKFELIRDPQRVPDPPR